MEVRRVNFTLPVELEELSALLLEFIELVGDIRWRTRADQLRKDALRSPAHAVIVANSHWLEMELSEQLNLLSATRKYTDIVSSYTLSALYFAGMVVEVHRRLAPEGRVQLFGRLRDSVKTGFAGLYLEMEMARVLLEGDSRSTSRTSNIALRMICIFGQTTSRAKSNAKAFRLTQGERYIVAISPG